MIDLSGLDKFSDVLGASPADAAGIREIPIAQIDADPDQPRKTFDQAKLMELAESIKAHGVIQPVVLRSAGGRYQLIAGERRWRAAGLAKLASLPAIVRDDLTARAQMVENLQREDLSTFDIYRVIAAELDAGTSQKDLATSYGKSKPWISDYAAVAKMPPALQDAMRDGRANDISALAALARLHKQAPEKVEQLAGSGAPITRHLVNQLAETLARKATSDTGNDSTSSDAGKTKAEQKIKTLPTTSGADDENQGADNAGGLGSGVADDGEGLVIGGRGPAAVSGVGNSTTSNVRSEDYQSTKPLPQDLAVAIKVRYEDDTYWLRYERQKHEGGRVIVMIATDEGLTLYAPLEDLVIVSVEVVQ